MSTQNTDEKVKTKDVFKTFDYKKFKRIVGNRPINERHVSYLTKKMKDEGNLMDQFPVAVLEDMSVIDGQHRIKAAERNKFPVYYEIKDNLSDDLVITLNTGQRNWGWLDYASYHAERGNANYKEFMRLAEEYKLTFTIILAYCVGTSSNANFSEGSRSKFNEGDFKIKDIELTRKLLRQYMELREDAEGIMMREFAYAVHSFMRRPGYDHEEMRRKVRAYGDGLHRCYTVLDFLLELESIQKA